MNFNEPTIDYAGISPLIALTVGLCVVLLSAVFKPFKRSAPLLTMVTLAAAAGLLIWHWEDPKTLISGALRLDDLAISISLIAILTAAFCVLLSIRERATEEAGSGEYHALLLGSVLGMVLLAQATNLVTFFVALATLAMPGSANFVGELYILNGLFQEKIVFAFVAITGVAMSAYYALRLYQQTMHNRTPSQGDAGLLSREIGFRDSLVLVPLVLCIVGLALYPQLILERTSPTVEQTVAKVQRSDAPEAQLAREDRP